MPYDVNIDVKEVVEDIDLTVYKIVNIGSLISLKIFVNDIFESLSILILELLQQVFNTCSIEHTKNETQY